MSNYLTPADVAADLGVSIETVYGWLSKGIGPDRIKVGRHVRITRPAYERWLAARTVKGAA